MRTLRGTTIIRQEVTDSILNIYTAYLDDGRKVVVRQPRRGDTGKLKLAWRNIGEVYRKRYRRAHVDQSLYDMKKRCRFPLYDGVFPGILPLVIEVDGDIVGFMDIFFKWGRYFPRFNVEEDSKCANGSIVALDKYHGLGIGILYSEMSNYIARHYGCKYILGRTLLRGGMRGIRSHDDWKIIATDGKWVDHIKTL